MIKWIITDIEGTTTAIDFVHRTLFPYSKSRIADFIRDHQTRPEVQEALEAVRNTLREEIQRYSPKLDECIEALESWIKEDRKHPGLKALQGHIWENGYKVGDYQGHVYPDVKPCIQQWKKLGLQLAVYSSGSVKAQKLLFSHSSDGDLTQFFDAYFDTSVGGKREVSSYRNILEKLQVTDPSTVYFLSDIVEELQAAANCGIQVIQLLRDRQTNGLQPSRPFPTAIDFFAVSSIIGLDKENS